MTDLELVVVVAADEADVIGRGMTVPWDLPADRQQYKERVAGHPVIAGRRTGEVVTELDVPRRILLTRAPDQHRDSDEVVYVGSPASAVEQAAATGADTAYVIGGAAIYELFLPHSDRVVLSRVAGTHDGDAYFPELGPAWREVRREARDGFDLVEYVQSDPEPLGQ